MMETSGFALRKAGAGLLPLTFARRSVPPPEFDCADANLYAVFIFSESQTRVI